MITSDEQLKRTQVALAELENAMAALSRKKDDIHPDWFIIMAEPMLDQIQQLRSEIDTYTGIAEAQSQLRELAKQS